MCTTWHKFAANLLSSPTLLHNRPPPPERGLSDKRGNLGRVTVSGAQSVPDSCGPARPLPRGTPAARPGGCPWLPWLPWLKLSLFVLGRLGGWSAAGAAQSIQISTERTRPTASSVEPADDSRRRPRVGQPQANQCEPGRAPRPATAAPRRD